MAINNFFKQNQLDNLRHGNQAVVKKEVPKISRNLTSNASFNKEQEDNAEYEPYSPQVDALPEENVEDYSGEEQLERNDE